MFRTCAEPPVLAVGLFIGVVVLSGAYSPACVTMARNRSVCPASQLVMNPPNEAPQAGRGVALDVIAARDLVEQRLDVAPYPGRRGSTA